MLAVSIHTLAIIFVASLLISRIIRINKYHFLIAIIIGVNGYFMKEYIIEVLYFIVQKTFLNYVIYFNPNERFFDYRLRPGLILVGISLLFIYSKIWLKIPSSRLKIYHDKTDNLAAIFIILNIILPFPHVMARINLYFIPMLAIWSYSKLKLMNIKSSSYIALVIILASFGFYFNFYRYFTIFA